jgi:Lon protease-like protein
VQIVGERPQKGYRVAIAELLEDAPGSAVELIASGERVRALFAPLVGRMGQVGEGVARALRSLPAERVPEALASVVLRSDEARQAFLAENRPAERAAMVEEAVLTLLAEVSGAETAEA